MKQILFLACCAALLAACNSQPSTTVKEESKPAASNIQLPYTAEYSSQWNDKVSDEDLLTVLNSYKFWQTNDMKALEGTLADSVHFESYAGFKYNGPKAGLLKMWTKSRDSLSKVDLMMDAWVKSHSIDKNTDFVTVWYKEIDTYKDGRVDSAYYVDDNLVEKGKIVWYAQSKRVLK
jgi:hypothetical protein